MFPGIRATPNGYRMACPRGHTDLILRKLSGAYAPQIYCPYCHNKDGSIQPVCSIRQIESFAEIFSRESGVPILDVMQDACGYFGFEVKTS